MAEQPSGHFFTLRIRGHFAAAHRILRGEGEEPLHGHTYRVEAAFSGFQGNNDMVVDFEILKKSLDDVLEGLDHSYLNDIPALRGRWPTAETLSVLIAAQISSLVTPHGVTVEEVTVWESDRAGVTYRPTAVED